MKLQVSTLALAMALAISGCATITRGTAQDFTIESTPAGATVTTSNGFECAATPCTFRMQRKHGFTVTASMPGYEDATASVQSEMSSAGATGMVGNVLIGGIIGVGVDATSGATNDLRPNPLHFTLTPVQAPGSATTVSLPVSDETAAAAIATDASAPAAVEAAPVGTEAAAPAPSN